MKHTHYSLARLTGASLMLILALGIVTTTVKAQDLMVTNIHLGAPEAIYTLSIPFFTTNTATLRWEVSSPDEDTDAMFDIRYSNEPLNASNFSKAQAIFVDLAKLSKNGNLRTYTVSDLKPGATYYFAMKLKFASTDWSDISDIPSIALPTHAPTSSTFPNTNLGYGNSGVSVSDLQTFLTKQGLYSGPITTYFGSMTKKAVILFQKKNNITPAEGYVGPITRAAIFAALKTQK